MRNTLTFATLAMAVPQARAQHHDPAMHTQHRKSENPGVLAPAKDVRQLVAAKDAGVTADLRPALEALANVTAQCVACHAGYRLK